MASYKDLSGFGGNYVMLELGRRSSGDTTGGGISQNRIGLLANTLTVSTNKQSLAFPIPFSGIISGESSTLAIDLGLATKTITLSGIIMEQEITKQNKFSGLIDSVKMTPHEVAQLIHSYVDSSFLHEDQNLSKIIVLIPSRVDTDFVYRSDGSGGTHENTDTTELPLIPFNWANRDYDIPQDSSGFKLSLGGTNFPGALGDLVGGELTEEIPGIPGFINDFSTDFVGTDVPSVNFSLTFTNASTAASDFINSGF